MTSQESPSARGNANGFLRPVGPKMQNDGKLLKYLRFSGKSRCPEAPSGTIAATKRLKNHKSKEPRSKRTGPSATGLPPIITMRKTRRQTGGGKPVSHFRASRDRWGDFQGARASSVHGSASCRTLVSMELSLRELARRMGCGPMRISEIVRGKRSITAETSILLGRALGVSPAFWLGIQMDHDLALAALALEKKAAGDRSHDPRMIRPKSKTPRRSPKNRRGELRNRRHEKDRGVLPPILTRPSPGPCQIH